MCEVDTACSGFYAMKGKKKRISNRKALIGRKLRICVLKLSKS